MERELAGDDGLEREIGFCGEVADEDDGAAAADGCDCEVERGGDADDFEGDIRAVSTREARDLGGDVDEIGAEGVGGAEFAGEGEAVVGEIDGDDARGPGPAQSLDDEKPDHAGAHDDGRCVGREMYALDGVDGDGDGLDHGGLLIGEIDGERVEDACRHREKFGEGAVLSVFGGSDADDAAMIAQVDLATCAVRTGTAGNRGIKRHAIAQSPALYARTDGDDFARRFVPHDERRPAAASRAIPAVNIAAADPAGVDA